MAEIDSSRLKDSAAPVVSDEAVAAEAERIVGRASGRRWGLKALVLVLGVAGLGLGGTYGYAAYREQAARDVTMVDFPATEVSIGNDERGAEGSALSERPAHVAAVADFALDAHEVTATHYRLCVASGDCTPTPKAELCTEHLEGADEHPINCVTHAQAEAYCAWVDKRLPTEVEWEYAAGGVGKHKRIFPWGEELPDRRRANVCGSECTYGAQAGSAIPGGTVCNGASGCRSALFGFDDGAAATAPVGSYRDGDSPEGLSDLAGNVWEWTQSGPCTYPNHECPPQGERVIRGGGFTHRFILTPEVTTRQKLPETAVNPGVGFRCAR